VEEEGWCPSTGDLGGIGRNRASSSDAGTSISESPCPSFALSFPFPFDALTGLFLRACFVGLSAPSAFSTRQAAVFELSGTDSSSSSSYVLLMVLRSSARRPLTAGRDPRRKVLLMSEVELIERVRIDEGWAVEGVLDLLAMEGVVEEVMMRGSVRKKGEKGQIYTSRRGKGGRERWREGPGKGMSRRSETYQSDPPSWLTETCCLYMQATLPEPGAILSRPSASRFLQHPALPPSSTSTPLPSVLQQLDVQTRTSR